MLRDSSDLVWLVSLVSLILDFRKKAIRMTPYRKRMTAATRRMAEDMLIRNMAVRTIDSYTYHVDRFAKHFGKLPEDLGPEQIREFQLWMIQEKKCSWSSFNQVLQSVPATQQRIVRMMIRIDGRCMVACSASRRMIYKNRKLFRCQRKRRCDVLVGGGKIMAQQFGNRRGHLSLSDMYGAS